MNELLICVVIGGVSSLFGIFVGHALGRGRGELYDWRGLEMKVPGRDEWVDIDSAAKAGYVRAREQIRGSA